MALRHGIVFFDKDGTLIHDVPFNADPALVKLRPGAAPALRRLVCHGYAIAVASNQSGIALGCFAPEALTAVWDELRGQLGYWRAPLRGLFVCPHHPDAKVPAYRRRCSCRKPLPGLLERGRRALRGLPDCWMVGDILHDVEAGRRAGCRTILLVPGGETEWHCSPLRRPHHTATSLVDAARIILRTRA